MSKSGIDKLFLFEYNDKGLEEDRKNELEFTHDAKQMFFKYQAKLTELVNNPDNECFAGIYPKIEMYTIRFALIFEILHRTCAGENIEAIGIKSVESAIKLSKYFLFNIKSIYKSVFESTPVEKLSKNKKDFYESLPETFETQEAKDKGKIYGLGERSVQRLLTNKTLFIKLGHGQYEKLY